MAPQGLGSSPACYTNHPGMVDFQGHSYMFYHSQPLAGGGAYHRSVCVEEFTYNEDGSIPELKMSVEGPDAIGTLNPFNRTEAETFAWGTAVETEMNKQGGVSVCDIKDGSSLKVENVDFGDKEAIRFHASVASDSENAAIEVRLDSEDGEKIGTIQVPNTGSKEKYETCTIDITPTTGVHDLYFLFTGSGEEELFKFDYWQFEKEPEPEPTVTPAPPQTPAPPAVVTPVPAPTVTPPAQPKNEKIMVAKTKGLSVKKQKGKKAKVSWKAVKNADGYQVVYATDKKMKKGVKKSSTKKTSYTIKKLKRGKKYFVKVRAYQKDQAGKKVYGSYSSVKKFNG